MTEAVVAAIEYYAAAVGTEMTLTAAEIYFAAQVITVAASAAYLNEQQRRQQRNARDAHNSSLQDRYMMVRSATEPRQIVLGRQRVSGPIAYVGSYGGDREHLVFIVVLAAHECDAIEKIYFDDEEVVLDGSDNVVAVNRRDLFTITTSSATFNLSSDPVPGTVVAKATYGTTEVTLGVSMAGRAITVTGATSGATGTLNVTYQPNPSPFAYVQRVETIESITLDGSGDGSITLLHTPVTGSVSVTGYTGTGQDVVFYDLAAYTTVSGSTVTVTGWPGGVSTWSVTYTWEVGQTRARVRKYLGAPGQAADAGMMSALPGVWTSAHTMTGLCYLVIEADYDPNAFPSGLMNVSAVVRGAKLYDPRTSTPSWSENPALMMRYVTLTPLLTRMTSSSVLDTYISAAANVCDTSSSYVVDGRTYTRAKYTAGLTLKSGTRAQDALNDLALSMAGKWVIADGQLRIKAGGYVTPLQTIEERWLHNAQAVRYQPRSNRSDVFNVVKGKFADQQRDYRQIDYPSVASSTYIAEDGQELETEITLNAVSFVGQCQQVVASKMREARIGERLNVLCNMRAYAVEVFDTVYVTLPRWGMSGEEYEVLDASFSIEGGIMLTLQRTDSTVFALGTSFDALPLPPNSRPPSLIDLPAVTGATFTVGSTVQQRQADGTIIPRLLVEFDAPTDVRIVEGGGTEIRFGIASTPEETWESQFTVGAQSQLYLTGLLDRGLYLFKLRHFTTLFKGQWTLPELVLNSASARIPSNVSGLTATVSGQSVLIGYTPCPDNDYAATELRYGASWAAGTLIWRGSGSAPPAWLPATTGSLTVRAKHFSRSGIESATDATTAVTFSASVRVVSPGPYVRTINGTGTPTTCVSGIKFKSTGAIAKKASGTSSTYNDSTTPWCSGSPPATFYVRFVQATLSGGSLSGVGGGWLALTTDRTVELTATAGVVADATVDYQIAEDSVGNVVLSTGTLDLHSEST